MSRKLVILFLVLLLCFAACKRQSATNSNAAKPNPDVKDPDGFTPLMNAIKNNDNDGAKKAVEKGGNVNARSNSGITPLSTAAGLGNTEMVKYLLEKGADVNARADGNFTPLMQAAMVGQLEICKLLLDAGADPTVKDISNKTAADWAEKNNHKDIATLIRQKTATAQTGGAAPPNKN